MSNREMSEQDTQFSLGKLIGEKAQRDAIHIAVAPVVAAENLWPGARIGFLGNNQTHVRRMKDGIGIVDPFLPDDQSIRAGSRFWMFLLPNTITSLRHQWTHPAFTDAPSVTDDVAESTVWLRHFAERYEGSYDEMIEGAVSGKGICFGSDIEYGDFQAGSDFWHHIEVVTGKKIGRDHQDNTPFRCAC